MIIETGIMKILILPLCFIVVFRKAGLRPGACVGFVIEFPISPRGAHAGIKKSQKYLGNFAFFYNSIGSPGAYWEFFYKDDAGPWTQTGLSKYENKTKWKNQAFHDAGLKNN